MPIEGASWKAEARRPYDAAFAAVRHGNQRDLVLLTVLMVIAFASAYLLGRNITAPLMRLKRDALMMFSDNTVPSVDPYAPAEIAEVRSVLLKLLKEQQDQADELRASEKLLGEVFENVYEGIILHDFKGNFVRVNKRWLQMFNLTSEEVQGLNVRDISCEVPRDEVLSGLWEEVLSGQAKMFEWCCKRPRDGSTFDAEVFLYGIWYEDEQMLMACVRDVTESKRWAAEQQRSRDELERRVSERTEELAQAFAEIQSEVQQRIEVLEELRRKEQLLIQQSRLAAMGEMLGNIAHQWRQPLNNLALIIQEVAYTFGSGLLSKERMSELAGKAMALVKSMSQTIDDFRNLLGPDRQLETFSCKQIIEKVLSMVRLQAETRLSVEGDFCTEGFPNEFAHVVLNILNNANDVLQERKVGNPEVTIRIFHEADRLVITIADNGGGIPEALLDQIFDPYFTTKGPDRGTGIGLFMAKTIVHKMGGTLTARNTTEGAEFRIELKALESDRCSAS